MTAKTRAVRSGALSVRILQVLLSVTFSALIVISMPWLVAWHMYMVRWSGESIVKRRYRSFALKILQYRKVQIE